MSNRDKTIDVLKGIGIVLVVVGHTYGPFNNFIYLFHMPLFFMASGYCMSGRYTDNTQGIKVLLFKRLRSLWAPYFIVNSVFMLLNNTFVRMNIYTIDEAFLKATIGNKWGIGKLYDLKELEDRILHAFLFNGSTQLTGATWFLEVLFFVTLLYALIDFVLKRIFKEKQRKIAHPIVAILLFTLGCKLRAYPLFSKYRMSTILVVILIFELGIYMREVKFSEKTQWIMTLASFVVLLIMSSYGFVELSENKFTDPIFLIVTSILGWFLIYGISRWMCKQKILKGLQGLLCFFGKNSMPIIMFHFLCFKPVTLIQLKVYGFPQYMLAAFPVLKSDGMWWIAYSLCSLVLCTIIIFLWNYIKQFLESLAVKYRKKCDHIL